MTINSRSKGKRGELLAVHLLQGLWPNAHRSAAQGAGGHIAPDVDGTPFWVECKCGARPNIIGALEQALRDSEKCGDSSVPMVITHRTTGTLNARVLITIRASDLLAVAMEVTRAAGVDPVMLSAANADAKAALDRLALECGR